MDLKVGMDVKINPFIDLEKYDLSLAHIEGTVGVNSNMINNQKNQVDLHIRHILTNGNKVTKVALNDGYVYHIGMLIIKGVNYL